MLAIARKTALEYLEIGESPAFDGKKGKGSIWPLPSP
jgi:hypothetical protein